MEANGVFGQRVRERLGILKMNQADLATMLQVEKSTVSYYVRGRIPAAPMLDRLASILTVSVDYLLGRTDNPEMSRSLSAEALHRTDNYDDDLPEEARKQLADYKNYLRQKYGKK